MDLNVHSTSTTRETSPVSFEDGLSYENGFRGFKKLPIVLLERVDITPFLNNNRFENIVKRSGTVDEAQKLHLYKLSLQLSVVLVRSDLDKLKREFNETGNINNNISPKSNKILSRLKSSTKNIKSERQPLKRQDATKGAADSTQQLKILKGDRGNMKMEIVGSLKKSVLRNNSSQHTNILTNLEQSNNAQLTSNDTPKYLNVLTDKTSSENSTNNLSVTISPNQNPHDSNDYNTNKIDFTNPPKKAIIDPRSKKTIISRHHCKICDKYFSSNYSLLRHKVKMHTADVEMGCDLCGEKFARSSLLQFHSCPYDNKVLHADEGCVMSFSDMPNSLDDLNTEEDGMDDEDFDIPSPIVELTEYDESESLISGDNNTRVVLLQNKSYNLVLQEVPIEF